MLSPQRQPQIDARPADKKPPEGGEQTEQSGSARIQGLRKSALIEMSLFFLVTLLLDVLATGGTRFWEVAPHPFWIIVILMTVQYGSAE